MYYIEKRQKGPDMMKPIDRRKYMDIDEVKALRGFTEARHIVDLRKGNVGGVLAWMVVDLALSTGLRVSELVGLDVGSVVPQTEKNSKEQEKNPDKLATWQPDTPHDRTRIFDDPEALETEKRRQKSALIEAEQHRHEAALVGATHANT